MTFSNKLSPAEAERLAMLAEECSEVIQIVGKILRHGYESHHPDGGPDNREHLERELGDLTCIMEIMDDCADLSIIDINDFASKKHYKVHRYTHHQRGNQEHNET
jgi:NTP pyrophosphatase (non-canonical NTP hydrolase)